MTADHQLRIGLDHRLSSLVGLVGYDMFHQSLCLGRVTLQLTNGPPQLHVFFIQLMRQVRQSTVREVSSDKVVTES